MGTLGAGNHYAEIQVVEEIFDKPAARKMGIDRIGQVQSFGVHLLQHSMTTGSASTNQ